MSLLFLLHYQSIIIWLNCFMFFHFDTYQVLIALILALLCLFLMEDIIKHLSSSCRVQNNSHVFFPSHLFEFECRAFSARVVWLSRQEAVLDSIPFIMFNQCEPAPLSYFTRGDFSASPLCRWFWLFLPDLIFKSWILTLTRGLTLLPQLSAGGLPDCFTWLSY